MNNSARVGALVIVFGGLLAAGYGVLGRSLFPKEVNRFYALMDDAAGLVPGTRVLLAGVPIGTVEAIELASPTQARVTLAINKKVGVPTGSQALIPSSLTGIGDTRLLIVPPKQSTGLMANGDSMLGGKQKALDSILPNGESAVEELTRTMAAFRKILEDQQLMGGVKELLASTNKTIAEFGKTASNVNNLMLRNRASLDDTLRQAALSMRNVQVLTGELTALAKSGKIQGNTVAILENLKTTSEKADKLMANLNALIGDPELKASLKNIVSNADKLTASGAKMAENGEVIAANAQVMTEDGKQITKNIVTLTEKANEIATKASAIEDQLSKAIDKFLGGGGGGGPLKDVQTRIDFMREDKPGYYRTDVTAIIPQGQTKKLYVGLFDAFYGNRLTFQFGDQFNDSLGYRYGILASRPSVGVDYRIGPRTSWRGDLWDINEPRFDFRLSHDLGKGFLGWLGMDRVFKDNAPTIGLGYIR